MNAREHADREVAEHERDTRRLRRGGAAQETKLCLTPRHLAELARWLDRDGRSRGYA